MPANYPLGQEDGDLVVFNLATQIWERGTASGGDYPHRDMKVHGANDITIAQDTEYFISWYTFGGRVVAAAESPGTTGFVAPDRGQFIAAEVYSSKAVTLNLSPYVDGVVQDTVSHLVPIESGRLFQFDEVLFQAGSIVQLSYTNPNPDVAEIAPFYITAYFGLAGTI